MSFFLNPYPISIGNDNVDYNDLINKPNSSSGQIDDAVQKSHEHTNIELLETYTQTNTDISNAITDSHTHSNKSVLDRLDIDVDGNLTIDGTPIIQQ